MNLRHLITSAVTVFYNKLGDVQLNNVEFTSSDIQLAGNITTFDGDITIESTNQLLVQFEAEDYDVNRCLAAVYVYNNTGSNPYT